VDEGLSWLLGRSAVVERSASCSCLCSVDVSLSDFAAGRSGSLGVKGGVSRESVVKM
jgi:hypothetical protein